MLTRMNSTGRQLSQRDIENVEKELSLRLPMSYKQFLLKFNGGRPVESAIDFVAEKIRGGGDCVQDFYEVSGDISYGLVPSMKNHGDQLPAGVIFIASTAAGNYYLLSLREDSYGQIFYKDHEFEDKSPFDPKSNSLPESIVKVADSFEDFLSRLYDPDA